MSKLHDKKTHDNDMGAARNPARKTVHNTVEADIRKLFYDMSAFNILTQQIVYIVSDAFDVNGFAMCKDYGITYKVPG